MTQQLISTDSELKLHVIQAQEFIGGYQEILNTENYVSLKTFARISGEKSVKQISIAILGDTWKDGLDVDPMNAAALVENILENYPDVSLNDIKYFAKRVLFGQFTGKETQGTKINTYKYDVPTLCLMFQRYYSERLDMWEQMKAEESNQHKLLDKDYVHPDILKKFSDAVNPDLKSHQGIYKDLKHYCEVNDMKEEIFISSYGNLYDEYKLTDWRIVHAEVKNGKGELEEMEVRTIDTLTKDQFVLSKSNQFVVLQNQFQTQRSLNKMSAFLKIVEYCGEYEIEKLVLLCKDLGLWMIPTPFYFASKQCLMEGAKITFRYDIHKNVVGILNDFIAKLFADKSVSTSQILFIVSMIFNFSLNVNRFNKHNGN